ncbi:hypothetical protein MTR_7g006390 [Medicago truncatula]|uniref:Uncharacterized protein n=1 Tax=Medicago truncatula TaxID=3880 RepID=G7JGE4_MEDTR|nr:hypothetical protein MTR_7g006390 [Medicago truncatula]
MSCAKISGTAVPNNGVVLPPKIKEEPSAIELGTAVHDYFSPIDAFARQAGTARACGGHPSKDYSKSSTLNCGVLMEWATKKNMHLVDIGSTNNSYKPSFSHVLPYLHDLRIPLILM